MCDVPLIIYLHDLPYSDQAKPPSKEGAGDSTEGADGVFSCRITSVRKEMRIVGDISHNFNPIRQHSSAVAFPALTFFINEASPSQ